MRIEHLYRFPVKGLTAEALSETWLEPGQSISGDRRFAIAQGDAPFDTAAPAWLQKTHFVMLMRNASVAGLHALWDERRGELSLRVPGEQPFYASTQDDEGRAAISAYVTRHLAAFEVRGTLRFVEAAGHSFSDHRNKVVSLINLASLAALERHMGIALDPLRFRANLYFSGVGPWTEFDWLYRSIEIGGATLRVTRRIPRCAATEVNPMTARRDCDPVEALRTAFGHVDLGVYARVEAPGRIAVGDPITLLDP